MANHGEILEVVGSIESLNQHVPWTIGLSTLFEWTTWQTEVVLGVSTTKLIKDVIGKTLSAASEGVSHSEIVKTIEEEYRRERQSSLVASRTERPKRSGMVSPYESLRRARFFSEDYLNREFDVFWSLVGDHYLNEFYKMLFPELIPGEWRTHSNSTLIAESAQYYDMQFDNLAYNPSGKTLIANELKLGGNKNPDQIIKYVAMFRHFRDLGFISHEDNLRLLFIGLKPRSMEPKELLLQREVDYYTKQQKQWFLEDREELIETAGHTEIAAVTWGELIRFNGHFLNQNPNTAQTLKNLITGMNRSLMERPSICEEV